MQEISLTAPDEEVKQVVRDWVDLLAQGRFADALAVFLPETVPANGSVDANEHPQWTPELLEAVIRNGGSTHVWPGERTWKVVAVEDSFRQTFEESLWVGRASFERLGHVYCGQVHVDLPWNGNRGNCVGDLTARFLLRPVNGTAMVLVLEDIHVL
jgi:hypothetical protein